MTDNTQPSTPLPRQLEGSTGPGIVNVQDCPGVTAYTTNCLYPLAGGLSIHPAIKHIVQQIRNQGKRD